MWTYHKTLCPEGKILRSAEDEEKLGPGWVDTPAKFDQEPEAKKQSSDAVDELVEHVAEKAELKPETEESAPLTYSRKARGK